MLMSLSLNILLKGNTLQVCVVHFNYNTYISILVGWTSIETLTAESHWRFLSQSNWAKCEDFIQ